MHRTQHRFLSILVAGTVALSLGASPALAGSDGCAGGDCQDENTPAPVVPVAPTPVAPAPLQSPSPSSDTPGPAASENGSKPTKKRAVKPRVKGVQTKNVSTRNTTVAQTTVPQGSVSAGAGGMAAATPAQGPEGAAFGLAGIALALLAAGGGIVVAGRRSES